MPSKRVLWGYIKVGLLLLGASTLIGLFERWSGAFGLSWWVLTWAWQRGFRPKWLLFSGLVMDFWLLHPLGVSAVVAGMMVLALIWTREKQLPWWIWWGAVLLLNLLVSFLFVDPSVTFARVILSVIALCVMLWRQRQSS